VFFGDTNSYAAGYPKPVGHVNDFAGLLKTSERQTLETTLRNYEKQTSIEIAIVTVLSLEGLTVEGYTIALAKSWGVGKKGKDNGVVFLVAPKERKMRIEVGYGLEPDLTDAQAGRIVRDSVVPRFKDGQMSAGIALGISAIMQSLGDKPYEERLNERKAQEEKARREAKFNAQRNAQALKVIGGVILGAVILILVVALYRRAEKRRKERKMLARANAAKIKSLQDLIGKAQANYAEAMKKLEELKSEGGDWKTLEKYSKGLPARVVKLEELLAREARDAGLGRRPVELVAKHLVAVEPEVLEAAGFLESVRGKIAEIKQAKKETPGLLRSLPDEIQDVEKKVDKPDVTDKTKNMIDKARGRYKEAKKLAGGSTEWLLLFAALIAVRSLLEQALRAAEEDKKDAVEARKPKPKRVYSSPVYVSSGSFSWSDSSSEGSSDGGSFGGFGGGDFGGGGASGDW